jgi:hypothetical protein
MAELTLIRKFGIGVWVELCDALIGVRGIVIPSRNSILQQSQ